MALYPIALTRILPAEKAYVALFTTAPGIDGLNAVEASYAGYARQEQVAWATHQDLNGAWYISNTGAIVFPAVTGASLYVVSWGIYTFGGDLLASGPVLNNFGVVYPQLLMPGDQARFLDDALKIRSGS